MIKENKVLILKIYEKKNLLIKCQNRLTSQLLADLYKSKYSA